MKKNTALQKKYDNHKSAYEYYLNQLEDSKLTILSVKESDTSVSSCL